MTYHHVRIASLASLCLSRGNVERQRVCRSVNLAQLEVPVSADVHQSVRTQGTPAHVPGDAERAQAAGRLADAVGRECDLLRQEVGTSGAKAQFSLPLAAQVPEEESAVLLRIQGEETGIGEAVLRDLGQRSPGVHPLLHRKVCHALTHQSCDLKAGTRRK